MILAGRQASTTRVSVWHGRGRRPTNLGHEPDWGDPVGSHSRARLAAPPGSNHTLTRVADVEPWRPVRSPPRPHDQLSEIARASPGSPRQIGFAGPRRTPENH